MKAINLKKDLDAIESANLIAERYQNISQYENYGVKLYKVGKAIVFVMDMCNQEEQYLLDEDDEIKEAIEDPEYFLKNEVEQWASNESDTQIAEFQWGIENPEDCKYDGNEECIILVVGWFNGYQPVSWLTDNNDATMLFENSVAAQAWINDAEEEIYYLSHNEAGRPDYYIIEY